MKDKYKVPESMQILIVVKEAIKVFASRCISDFEISSCVFNYIIFTNRFRAKPIRVSYDYVSNLTYEMLRNKEI